MILQIPVSAGELIDKITILEIKAERITAPDKLENVRRELSELQAVINDRVPGSAALDALKVELKRINEALWVIEDDIRDCERSGEFGEPFVKLARAVYITNDRRAALKREINQLLGSTLVEEKSYQAY